MVKKQTSEHKEFLRQQKIREETESKIWDYVHSLVTKIRGIELTSAQGVYLISEIVSRVRR